MIESFKHKGLERFFYTGDHRGINPQHAAKIARILDRLDGAVNPQDMNLPGYRLHELSGRGRGVWSVWISGNWRVVFRFEGMDVIEVGYVDYH